MSRERERKQGTGDGTDRAPVFLPPPAFRFLAPAFYFRVATPTFPYLYGYHAGL